MGAGKTGFTKFRGVWLVDGAGYWPHEAQPDIVSQHLVSFLKST
jgi:pimeloyl-ACP methyl ester carboxylesterase